MGAYVRTLGGPHARVGMMVGTGVREDGNFPIFIPTGATLSSEAPTRLFSGLVVLKR